ncbi:MAG: hypothetical protein JWM98_1967 [Thermoleophilia bacterium]|nr:hypothetical protein [Thermoleophilia bacterium]
MSAIIRVLGSPQPTWITGEPLGSPLLFWGCLMAQRTFAFIDYWNFQLNWNDHVPDGKTNNAINWRSLGKNLQQKAEFLYQRELRKRDYLDLKGREIFAGLTEGDSNSETTRRWLEDTIGARYGWQCHIRNNKRRPKPAYCQKCVRKHASCPTCGEKFFVNEEKGVDTALATSLMARAWDADMDVAILLTSDSDFIPAVEHLKKKGVHVINFTWEKKGYELRGASSASVTFDSCWQQFSR